MKASGLYISAVVTTGLLLFGIATAAADDINCPPVRGSIEVDGNVFVTGACRLNGTEVEGNVVLFSGGSLVLRNAEIDGNIQSSTDGPFEVDIDNSRIDGNIQLDGLVGDETTIRGSEIDGNIQVDRNGARLRIIDNTVEGNVQAVANTGGVDIVGNRIDGNLECQRNNPAPTGQGNTVDGNREGQCVNLDSGASPDPDEPEQPADPVDPVDPDSGNTDSDPAPDGSSVDAPGDNTAEESNLKGSSDLVLLGLLALLLLIAALRPHINRS